VSVGRLQLRAQTQVAKMRRNSRPRDETEDPNCVELASKPLANRAKLSSGGVIARGKKRTLAASPRLPQKMGILPVQEVHKLHRPTHLLGNNSCRGRSQAFLTKDEMSRATKTKSLTAQGGIVLGHSPNRFSTLRSPPPNARKPPRAFGQFIATSLTA
jgi:hypothetical protein